MKYTCDCVNSLFFDYDGIKCGCSNTGGYYFVKPFNNKLKIENCMSEIKEKREQLIENFKNGILPEQCKNCYMLKEDINNSLDNPLPKELDKLYVSHWYHCNCGCVYCCNGSVTHLKITPKPRKSEYYDAYPFIKYLCKNGYIGAKTFITTIGGEPAVLKEFDKIMKDLIKYSKEKLIFLSSSIKFSDTIYKILKRPDTVLIISLDCGSAECYRKIKRTDAFEQVIKNIKKYVSANPSYEDSVQLKYILVKGLNDNLEELKKFFDVVRETKVKKVFLDVDHNNFRGNSKEVPDYWYDLFEYFLAQKDVNAEIHDLCRQILEKKQIF